MWLPYNGAFVLITIQLRPPVESLNRPTVQPNPARPPKRVLPPESIDDEPYYRQTNGNGNGGPSYQQTDSKRRRTNEDLEEELRQKMPPPVRQSVIRKVSLTCMTTHISLTNHISGCAEQATWIYGCSTSSKCLS
jgi:hypothetical protein